MNYPLLQVSIGYIKQHILQTVLLVIGIAFGVALMVSVDIANQSASRSFALSQEILSTKSTHRIVGSYSDIDETLYRTLKQDLGLSNIAPVIEDYVNLIDQDSRGVRLLGTDFFADLFFYDDTQISTLSQNTLSELMTIPGTALISSGLAQDMGLDAGDVLTLSYGSKKFDIKILDILDSNESLSESLGSLILTDIATAQELLGKVGTLSRIDLIIDESNPEYAADLRRIEGILPPSVQIRSNRELLGSTKSLTRSFELNLTALSLLALFVGVFLIYNIVSFSVIQRRSIIGTLRSIGATRRQIFSAVILESLIIGSIGSVIGVLGGIVLGRSIVSLVTRSINDLYYTVTVTNLALSPETIIKGVVAGILAAIIATLIPAIEASRVRPINILRRSNLENHFIKSIPFITFLGFLFILLGIITIALPTKSLLLSLLSIFLILFGVSLLVPLCTSVFMRFCSLVTNFGGVVGRMAPRNIVRSTSRTGVAIASLTVAISVILSVSIMIGSFRSTVVDWLDTVLTADIFISMDSPNISSQAGLDRSIVEKSENFPGVDRVATVRRLLIDSPEYKTFNLVAVTQDLAARNRNFIWQSEDREKLWDKMQENSVLISESFAYKNGVDGPGSIIQIPTDYGMKEFEVAGIYYDYGAQTGVVLISDPLFRALWNDNQITSLGIYISKGQDVEKKAGEIRALLSDHNNLSIRPNTALKESAIKTFDRTFTVTAALRVLIAIVAFISVLSCLMALQLERGRELGVLRALGMTVSQVRKMMFLENSLIGLASGIFSIPVGIALSVILIYVINLRSFGWTLNFSVKPQYFLEAIAIALLASLAASIYPAVLAAKQSVGKLIREE